MPLVVSHFTSVFSVKVAHMTDSVDPALFCDLKSPVGDLPPYEEERRCAARFSACFRYFLYSENYSVSPRYNDSNIPG